MEDALLYPLPLMYASFMSLEKLYDGILVIMPLLMRQPNFLDIHKHTNMHDDQ